MIPNRGLVYIVHIRLFSTESENTWNILIFFIKIDIFLHLILQTMFIVPMLAKAFANIGTTICTHATASFHLCYLRDIYMIICIFTYLFPKENYIKEVIIPTKWHLEAKRWYRWRTLNWKWIWMFERCSQELQIVNSIQLHVTYFVEEWVVLPRNTEIDL